MATPTATPSKPKTILVAVDGSQGADWAFHAAVHHVHPEMDTVILVSVAQIQTLATLKAVSLALTSAILDFEKVRTEYLERIEHHANTIVTNYVDILKQLKIQNYKGIIASSSNAGEVIVDTANQYNVDAIFVGTRGLGKVTSLILGSVSRYVVDHAHCDVSVVKKEPFPAEIHPATTADVKKAEEMERQRRLSDPGEAAHAELAAHLAKRVVVLGPEAAELAARSANRVSLK
jgi:nucleotide-binding universal stress UspA family protein